MMNSSDVAILARGLTVVRGDRTVLKGIDFTVPPGRITGLLGPSGCGKSTLMRAVVGTQAKVTGTLDILGTPAGHAALRSRIGYVTQAPSIYDDLTVQQNLDYFASVLRPGRGNRGIRQDHVTRAIADVDLTSHADSLAGRLSGGQRSRVSLAVALLGTPELLVLDEPTVGLDPVLRRDLWALFHHLAAARGTTILVSSHVMDEAERCHRLLLMRAGEVIAEDTPSDLRFRTGTDTVEAAFLHLVDKATARSAQTPPPHPHPEPQAPGTGAHGIGTSGTGTDSTENRGTTPHGPTPEPDPQATTRTAAQTAQPVSSPASASTTPGTEPTAPSTPHLDEQPDEQPEPAQENAR